jgi:hypothetical protein
MQGEEESEGCAGRPPTTGRTSASSPCSVGPSRHVRRERERRHEHWEEGAPLVRQAAAGGGVGLGQLTAAAMGQGGKIFFDCLNL